MPVSTGVLAHDMRYFAIAYALAVGVAFVPADIVWPRWAAAAVLLLIYAWYVRQHFQAEEEGSGGGDLAPLRLRRLDVGAAAIEHAAPRLRIVSFQVLLSLGLIILGAIVFVGAVERLATSLGVPEVLLALIVAPIATELPEKFNSVIWIRQSKDTLAMGNITGAMVFQSTIPTVVALLFASSAWSIAGGSVIAFASAGIAFASSAAIFIPMARRGRLRGQDLLVGGLFYAVYVGIVLGSVAMGPAPAH
jgi:cation:H+ antiporter